ncbi:hypothetical protein LRS73_28375 [Methylobacterium currus]|uniref:hypothetical protein n=1 Tax=Methylobacterium currus TaxID=2051553 RepID=UPI001E5C785F|nr:hypothetical protein [Methylobacterium currus]UHC16321.1 hypothetical protein LRS73_28375 [Methylobacterium currus]
MKKYLLAASVMLIAASTRAQYYGGYGTRSNSSGHHVQDLTNNNGTYVALNYQLNIN